MSGGTLPKRCRSCRYATGVDLGQDCEMLTACVYILHNGKRRPCPAGEECTVYESAVWKGGAAGDERMHGG